MKRLVSKKAERMLCALIFETKENIKFIGNDDWGWENTPVDECENESLLKDMLRSVENKIGHIEIDKKLNIISAEKAEINSKAFEIVRKHLNRRLLTYKE